MRKPRMVAAHLPESGSTPSIASPFEGHGVRSLLLGIAGSGVRSVAESLIDAGHIVVGSDIVFRRAADLRQVCEGEMPEAISVVAWDNVVCELNRGCDVVVASQAIAVDDVRIRTARDRGIPVMSPVQAAALLWRDRRQICVAGTHGKTTTTALLDRILTEAGAVPGLFLGGRPQSGGVCGRNGTPPFAIVESCEYRRAFCALSPSLLVLTGIDRDHFDSFADDCDEVAAYSAFVDRLRPGGQVIAPADCLRSAALLSGTGRSALRVSDTGAADWRATAIRHSVDGTSFTAEGPQQQQLRVTTQLFGRHNVINTMLAIAAADSLGITGDDICRGVSGFSGVRRRFEIRGTFNGVTLIDDYAHHPTAITATLKAVRQRFAGRRLIAVVEPHQASRLRALSTLFRDALLPADESLILPVLPARENLKQRACLQLSGELVRKLNSAGQRAFLMANLDQATARIDHSARPGDVVITMGAGNANRIHDELTRKLLRDRAA